MNDGEYFDALVQGYHFWAGEVESARKKTLAPDGKKFRYFDDKGIFNFVFFIWIYKWVKEVSKKYLDPYMLHPLPLADQILIWQPILSRHISDGIASLEEWESIGEDEEKRKPVKFILWRAVILTYWKRLLAIMIGVVIMNIIGIRVAIYLHRLLHLLSEGGFGFLSFVFLALSIIAMELFKDIGMCHINYYVTRLQILMDASLRTTVFQHGLCYRRNRFNDIPDVCKSIIHSCSGDTLCSKDPLMCPARRYKNNEVTPKMYALVLNDSHYVPYAVECASGLVDFVSAFAYGLILISRQFNMKAMTILIVSLTLVTCMIIVEMINGFLFKYFVGIRDNRIAKSEEVISSLHLIERMSLDDIGHDIITETRNDELVFVFIRFLISLLNKVIYITIICLNIIILINDFVEQVRNASDVKDIDPSGLLASIFVIMKIVGPLYTLSFRLELVMFTINASRRLELFFRTCSPNFYLPDNKFTGEVSLPEALPDKDKTIPKGMMVMFKKASFAWVNSRKDLLDKTGTTCLENLDFILNTGDLAIITGSQGSGKTNFVKAILGDMTLVDGSMAVLPLSTNMPIFYASQDVWIQKGTIRSNIIFGHKFDEDIYNTVIKAIELEHDISTWEEGDLRKITEHGYSLSGGQRVRVGLARAIYAYLIYSKTNREENNSKCSFLVVLDDVFTGLDPFVAKIIFRNLFDKRRGILASEDVSTVLTISKRILDACVSSGSSTSFPKATIYSIRSKGLVKNNNLVFFTDNESKHPELPRSNDKIGSQAMPNYIRKTCLSDDYTRAKRREIIEFKYAESPTFQALHNGDNTLSVKDSLRSYQIYFIAAGLPILLFFIFTIISATLDNTKFIIASRISDSVIDYTKKQEETTASLEDIRNYCTKILRWIVIISEAVMIGALIRVLAMVKASFNASRKIHEYAINSIFVHSPAVLEVKKSLSSILTFLYMDTLYIDCSVGYFIYEACLSLIESNVHLFTLLFMLPWSAPLIILLFVLILKSIVQFFFRACRKIGFARLESFSQIDSVIETAISGLPLYRSFKKEWELVYNMAEQVDYNLRCTYLSRSVITGCTIVFRCLFSPLALFILVFPLLKSRWFGTEVKIGYYGMAYSIFLSLTSSFTSFLGLYSYLETSVMSVKRFESFVPPNTPIVFDKKKNINLTDIVVDRSWDNTERLLGTVENSVISRRCFDHISRRAIDFCGFKVLFFKHNVNVLDISKYTIPGHIRIQLNGVSVHLTTDDSGERRTILKNVTCSANTSDIVGIIGRTGAGKSTMLSVLQNLARNRDGSVLLDGCDLRDIPKSVTRQVIGVLPQLPFVFRGWTVRRFIDPRKFFDDIDINLALENCGLLKFVENLPGGKGLNTIILPDHYHRDMPKYYKRAYYGPSMKPHDSHSKNVNVDYGMALSNSQLRTLSVARLVLYREFFKILLVDEPPEDELGTSKTIDTPIYELIKKYFRHCTTFIAAHDANVLRLCTSVWVFHDGSLIKTCKTEDIVDSSSLSKIIEDCISQHA